MDDNDKLLLVPTPSEAVKASLRYRLSLKLSKLTNLTIIIALLVLFGGHFSGLLPDRFLFVTVVALSIVILTLCILSYFLKLPQPGHPHAGQSSAGGGGAIGGDVGGCDAGGGGGGDG